ncbi:MAG: glycosyltransferase family 2 protein [Eubacteriales bacterium]|nr:glycosyltransferase family 2 protein [Eubacteriales bacterium]
MLSIILPAYNEEEMICIAVETISGIMRRESILFEIVLVDDGSQDRTWEKIQEASAQQEHVVGLHFSRNFGKEAAMFAGLEHASGDCCVVMDCDLQHPPEKIVEMYRLWEQGYEVVEGIKEERGDETQLHRFAASSFYKLISRAAQIDMEKSSDFKLLDRKVVDALNQIKERSVFFRALSYWVGFRRASVSYAVQERQAGQSKWSTRKLFQYALKNITSFSSAPMQIVTWSGVLFFILAVVLSIQTLARKLSGQALDGFTTVILLEALASGLIMISIGIIGYYIARIYDEIKQRPRYIISKTCGENNRKQEAQTAQRKDRGET